MKKVFNLLFSSKTTLILLLIFTIGIAAATFVEDKYDTPTAQLLVYQAWWFELVILLMVLNFIGNLTRYHFFSVGKLGGLLFHLGFILLIIGSAVTRYTGFEGTMRIREGDSSRTLYSTMPYLQVQVSSSKGDFAEEYSLYLSSLTGNNFSHDVSSGYEEPVTIDFVNYINNAVETVNENIPGGTDMIAIQVSSASLSNGVYLKKGERINIGGVFIAFADTANDNDVLITQEGERLIARSKIPLYGISMTSGKPDTTQRGLVTEFREKNLFQYKGTYFTLVHFYPKAELDFIKSDAEDGIEVLTVNVAYKGQKKKVHCTGASLINDPGQHVEFGNLKVNVKYGPKQIELPFAVRLNDFILERYGGSMSPSSFASEVTVLDPLRKTVLNKRIFMNHVLDYQGYRFFQSSYDADEKGTILSVNHDFWGTWISYASYLVLMIGFVITMFSNKSRYHILTAAIAHLREKRKAMLVLITFFFCGGGVWAQTNHIVDRKEAEKFGRLLVQTYDGRIEPLHTLAYDAMHKIARKDKFDVEGKGKMDAMQVMIDMVVDAEFWKQQKMIIVREQPIRDLIGIDGRYASFNDFLEQGSQYKLADVVEKAFRKNPKEQNRFDKEVIKVDERLNLLFMLMQGTMMKIFPAANASSKWIDWGDSLAQVPLTGALGIINNDLQLKEFNYSNILKAYFESLMSGRHSGDYSKADRILGYIKNIQQNNVLAKDFPSETKISAEIRYNRYDLFNWLSKYYGVISFLMFILAFADNLISRRIKGLRLAQNLCVALLVISFCYHTYGMALRWYITGHAPWSNGYEAMLLISWSAILAGFFFIKNSKIIQAATAFLAAIILMTAGHSNYDPQLTNLQPVLKSYWLIIHVAVITISYGFLALGFILGIINMFLYIFKSKKKGIKTDLLINELTYINEKNLQIGLFLATLGTFLGGVWASESWGRYWGWDAKETWALVIIIVYSIILHLRLVPQLRSTYIFNIGSIIGFASVLMTFIGVNYYFSKGLHSYASDEHTVFPLWGWMIIWSVILLMVTAGVKARAPLNHGGYVD